MVLCSFQRGEGPSSFAVVRVIGRPAQLQDGGRGRCVHSMSAGVWGRLVVHVSNGARRRLALCGPHRIDGGELLHTTRLTYREQPSSAMAKFWADGRPLGS
jgi:hypothetical protein